MVIRNWTRQLARSAPCCRSQGRALLWGRYGDKTAATEPQMSANRTGVHETAPLIYSVALEQQVRLVRALTSADGDAIVAEDLFGELGDKLSQVGHTRGRVAQLAGQGLSQATPFFWAGHIARAIRDAVRTMPAYTFTA